MSEDDPLDPELVRSLESLAHNLGFMPVIRVSKQAFTLYRNPTHSTRERVEQELSSLITSFGLIVRFEWSESNYERLTVFLFTPEEHERLSEENRRLLEQNRRSKPFEPYIRQETPSNVVRGTIGATIGGKIRIYPDSDQEEIYVTLPGERSKYIECDATELPPGIEIYFGFPVMVDKGKRIIVGPAERE